MMGIKEGTSWDEHWVSHVRDELLVSTPETNTKRIHTRGARVAQSVKRLTSAQVMISRSVSSIPVSGSVLRAQSLEPASDSGSPSLSAPPLLMLCLSLSQK